MEEKQPKNPLVQVATYIAGSIVGVVALGLFMGPYGLWPIVGASFALAFLGVGIAYFIKKQQ